MTKLFILKVDEKNKDLYRNHSSYHEGDAGLDLFITEDRTILPGETRVIDLEIKCQSKSLILNPFKWYTRGFWKYHSYLLVPRSSISRTPLIMRNSIGLIDSGYTGTLKIPMWNTSKEAFYIKRGQRFVQLVNADLSPVKFELSECLINCGSRGEGGFGSTG